VTDTQKGDFNTEAKRPVAGAWTSFIDLCNTVADILTVRKPKKKSMTLPPKNTLATMASSSESNADNYR